MGNFQGNNKFGGRENRGGFSGRNPGRPSMHRAVCDECGKECEVPFKPTGDKPIYCNDCFKNKKNDSSRRPGGGGDKKMYKAICDKCGKECEVPFNPTGDKPIYCNQCFGKVGRPQQAGGQFEIINSKLDKILEALSPSVTVKDSKKKKPVKKVAISKPKKVAKSKAKKVASPKKVTPKAKKKK